MQISELYAKHTGHEPVTVTPLTPAGSNRRYYRLEGGGSAIIGVEGSDRRENDAFIYLSCHFIDKGLPVPEVLAISNDGMSYLVTDLGDSALFAKKDDIRLLEKAMRTLARFHYEGSEGLDYAKCFPVKAFDRQSVMWDLNYFKYSFLNTSGVAYDEPRLEEDFVRLAGDAAQLTESEGVFMLRDFQSRNVMVKDREVYFIDFQGGRRGPAAYDIASFIWQAKAGFSPGMRNHLIDTYIEAAHRYADIDAGRLRRQVKEMALVRTLQVLGAYGLRGRFERKPHFIQSIPLALKNLGSLLAEGIGAFPYLNRLLPALTAANLPPSGDTATSDFNGLTVRVTSFSYKKGIPEDPSGNGGGYVFDCRAMDNPGRYEQYRSLTGTDRAVIDFLEGRGEIERFLESCYRLVDTAIDNYLCRGFNSLSVNYGCTGGRHRSVYSAQHTARHIKTRYPEVRVILTHREQGIKEVL